MSTSAGSSETPIEDTVGAQADDWVRAAAQAADDKLGQDTVVIAVGDLLSITDHFVITSGANRRQVKAIAEAVEEGLTTAGGPKPLRIEGIQHLDWVLMDYGEFVVHVFDSDTRSVYDLERLWGDCTTLDWRAGSA